MTDRVILILAAAVAMLLTVTAAALLARAVTTQPHNGSSDSATVATFNDGFATSKQDDCEQGFAPACAWLHSTR